MVENRLEVFIPNHITLSTKCLWLKIAFLPSRVAIPVVCVQFLLKVPTSRAPPLPRSPAWSNQMLRERLAGWKGQPAICRQVGTYSMVSVFCLKVYEGYGQTECTAGCTFTTPGDWTSGRIGWRCENELEQQALKLPHGKYIYIGNSRRNRRKTMMVVLSVLWHYGSVSFCYIFLYFLLYFVFSYFFYK